MTDPFASGQSDPFGDPVRQGKMPKMIELYGRLVLVKPLKIETVKDNLSPTPGATVDRLTADVDILDGTWPLVRLHKSGLPVSQASPGTPQPEPLTERHFSGMWINSKGIVSVAKMSLAGQGPQTILGRVSRGDASQPGWNEPYFLAAGTKEDKTVARAYIAQRAANNPQSLV